MKFKKLRLWATYPFAVFYLFWAWQYGIEFNYGLWFVLGGLLVRCWAAGHIKKIRELSTGGPYSFVRNPLYVGNFLMGLGFCLFVPNWLLSLVYTLLFAFFYVGTVRKEEVVLTNLFGQNYLNYKSKVPAFIPRLYPYESNQPWSYSLQQAHYNGELIRVFVTAVLLSVLYFAVYFLKDDLKDLNDFLLPGLFILGQVVLLLMTIKHRKDFVKKQDNR